MNNIDWLTIFGSIGAVVIAIALPFIMSRYVEETESDKFKERMAKRSTKIATIIGWTLIAIAVGVFIYFALIAN